MLSYLSDTIRWLRTCALSTAVDFKYSCPDKSISKLYLHETEVSWFEATIPISLEKTETVWWDDDKQGYIQDNNDPLVGKELLSPKSLARAFSLTFGQTFASLDELSKFLGAPIENVRFQNEEFMSNEVSRWKFSFIFTHKIKPEILDELQILHYGFFTEPSTWDTQS